MRARSRTLLITCFLVTAACGTETIVHDLGEREANQIIELLSESDISAAKGLLDTGRSVSYTISVSAKSRLEAIKLLNRYEMPRRRDMGYSEIFKDSGLIPTAAEEKSKMMAALEGEIEKQLKLVDGILDVQVQLVLPEDNALRTVQDVRSPTTASVTVRYMPNAGGAKPLGEAQVQTVVAAGVERLTPENVVVVMTPAGPLVRPDRNGPASGPDTMMLPLSKNARMIGFVLVGVILALSLILVVSQLRLRTVRSRLGRLQNEIAKARRKPTDMPPTGG